MKGQLDQLGQPDIQDIDPDVDWPALRHSLTLTPAERLERFEQMLAFVLMLRAAGETLRGEPAQEPRDHPAA